jgi:putative transposase
MRRIKVSGAEAVYHCMTRTVNGEMLFEDRDKEVLRKMLWQVAEFSGVEILTYCVMTNHFHVLIRIPEPTPLSDAELLRRYKVLYPKPSRFQIASVQELEAQLAAGGKPADAIRRRLQARMADVSEYMKTVKQRFSVWYNRNHQRFGTLWADRFKSVLVEGQGNPLQTMAAYIDLNPVRARLVEDPKDYRFCGYAEAVAGVAGAQRGLIFVWSTHGSMDAESGLREHRSLIFGKRASDPGLAEMTREYAIKVLNEQDGCLPKSVMLRCRVRYFTEGAILGTSEFVLGFSKPWQMANRRQFQLRVNAMQGADWGDLAVIQNLRRQVFS